MQEIEVKILEVDPYETQVKLEALGATLVFDGMMRAQFYDYPDFAISNRGDVLRLREEGDVAVLAYKSHITREGAKVMEEHETQIGDVEAMRIILQKSGLVLRKETLKHRRAYELGETHIVIDDYQGKLAAIPTFIEIEAKDLKELYKTVGLLGYTEKDCKSWSTYDLVQYYLTGD